MRYLTYADPTVVTTPTKKAAVVVANALGISELLEQILCHLGSQSPKDLFRAQRVSKGFHDAIHNSSALQAKLYLVRSDRITWDAKYGTFNPLLQHFMTLYGLVFRIFENPPSVATKIEVTKLEKKTSKRSRQYQYQKKQDERDNARRSRGSWPNMLVAHDSRNLFVQERVGTWNRGRNISKDDVKELRMGELMDSLTYCLEEY